MDQVGQHDSDRQRHELLGDGRHARRAVSVSHGAFVQRNAGPYPGSVWLGGRALDGRPVAEHFPGYSRGRCRVDGRTCSYASDNARCDDVPGLGALRFRSHGDGPRESDPHRRDIESVPVVVSRHGDDEQRHDHVAQRLRLRGRDDYDRRVAQQHDDLLLRYRREQDDDSRDDRHREHGNDDRLGAKRPVRLHRPRRSIDARREQRHPLDVLRQLDVGSVPRIPTVERAAGDRANVADGKQARSARRSDEAGRLPCRGRRVRESDFELRHVGPRDDPYGVGQLERLFAEQFPRHSHVPAAGVRPDPVRRSRDALSPRSGSGRDRLQEHHWRARGAATRVPCRIVPLHLRREDRDGDGEVWRHLQEARVVLDGELRRECLLHERRPAEGLGRKRGPIRRDRGPDSAPVHGDGRHVERGRYVGRRIVPYWVSVFEHPFRVQVEHLPACEVHALGWCGQCVFVDRHPRTRGAA